MNVSPWEEGEPREFGRAIVNYSSKDCAKMVGTQTANDFFDIVGRGLHSSTSHLNLSRI